MIFIENPFAEGVVTPKRQPGEPRSLDYPRGQNVTEKEQVVEEAKDETKKTLPTQKPPTARGNRGQRGRRRKSDSVAPASKSQTDAEAGLEDTSQDTEEAGLEDKSLSAEEAGLGDKDRGSAESAIDDDVSDDDRHDDAA